MSEETTESTLSAPVEAAPSDVPPAEPPKPTEDPLIQINGVETPNPHAGQYWDRDHQIWRDINPVPEAQPDRTGQHWNVESQRWLPDEVTHD